MTGALFAPSVMTYVGWTGTLLPIAAETIAAPAEKVKRFADSVTLISLFRWKCSILRRDSDILIC